MRNLILPLVFIAIALGFFYGCKKSATIHPAISPDVLQIQEARDYFQSKVAYRFSTPSNPNPRTASAKTPVWEQAQVMQLSNFKGVVVPLHYTDKLYLSGDFSGNKRYALNGLARLLMYKDTAGAYHSEIVTRLPDSNYTAKTGAPFTGMLLVEDWNGHVLFRYMDDGKTVRMEPDQSANDLSAGQRRVTTLSTYLICSQIYGYNSGGGETVYWSESGGCNYITMPNTQLMNFINISRVAGGGGGGTPVSPATTISIVSGTNPIGDILDYNKCFTNVPGTDHTYKVTICVDQPKPGTRQAWGFSSSGSSGSATGANPVDVGHTFLVFSETSGTGTITRNVGFYPQTSVNPWYPSDQGQLNNNSASSYTISLSINVTNAQFFNMLNYLAQGNNPGYMYNLNSNNCTTFALHMLAAGDVLLPSTVGTWLNGSGNNPGDLGEDIRNMPLSSNMARSTANSYHLNVGTCQ